MKICTRLLLEYEKVEKGNVKLMAFQARLVEKLATKRKARGLGSDTTVSDPSSDEDDEDDHTGDDLASVASTETSENGAGYAAYGNGAEPRQGLPQRDSVEPQSALNSSSQLPIDMDENSRQAGPSTRKIPVNKSSHQEDAVGRPQVGSSRSHKRPAEPLNMEEINKRSRAMNDSKDVDILRRYRDQILAGKDAGTPLAGW